MPQTDVRTTRTMKHMVIARTLFRRLVATEKDWRTVIENADRYTTRDEALAAIDALPDALVWMPSCEDCDETGKCLGHVSDYEIKVCAKCGERFSWTSGEREDVCESCE